MIDRTRFLIPLLMGLLLILGVIPATAGVLVQCPGDKDGDAAWNQGNETQPANTKCMHIAAGDGFATMGDGTPRYIFSFSDMTGEPTKTRNQKNAVMNAGMLAAEWPAPTIVLKQWDELYLTLTNVGMMNRPDLFDPHTVHYHGFPQAAPVFDGVPDASISIGMGSSLTYYYKNAEPGTYMYHCHVEATEHMQMGMLGNLYVLPAQDGELFTYNGKDYTTFVYNDGDGSTGYDVVFPIQIGSFDGAFHDASENTQPLPFALMKDNYPMLNGRGYPDTADPRTDDFPPTAGSNNTVVPTSQPVSSLITATAGDTILLRISNLNITRYYSLQSLGIPMRVVGKDAKQLRGLDPDGSGPLLGKNLSYTTNSVMLGGGESFDVMLDTAGVAAGKYFLYTSNLNYLSNDAEAFGGMMTEIVISNL